MPDSTTARTAAAPPLFRPEALARPDAGGPFAFIIPSWRRLGALGIAALLLIAVFAAFASFDRVAYAPGLVAPASGMSRLIAPQGGTISALLARQGQAVRKGQPILKIASTTLLPSGAAAPAEALATYRQQQQIAVAVMQAERERALAERARLAEQARRLGATATSLVQQIALQQERIRKNDEWLRSLAPLLAKGYVSNLTYRAQEEAGLTLRQQLASLEQRLAETRHEQAQARLDMTATIAAAQGTRLRSAASVVELERGAASAQAEAEVTVAAPIDGTLASISALAGETVAAGEEVAALMRSRDSLRVLLYVPSRSTGSLRRGQKVAMRFDAFPYQRYGLGRGMVEEVAAAAARRPGAGPDEEPSYRVQVKLLDAGPAAGALRPDMRLTASILVEERSLLDWLFAPLREKWRRGNS